MIEYLEALFHNPVLMTAVAGWFVAQVIKAILYGLLNHTFKLERLFGSGGMPSSHAATVLAMVVAASTEYGPGSFQFAICAVLAIIVIHDAQGVRLETGKQAEVLNKLMRESDLRDLFRDEKYLKELVGHTPFQVLVGGVLGLITGVVMSTYVF